MSETACYFLIAWNVLLTTMIAICLVRIATLRYEVDFMHIKSLRDGLDETMKATMQDNNVPTRPT